MSATERVAAKITTKAGPKFIIGTTVDAVTSGIVPVDVGGKVRSARVPQSVRGVVSGMGVRLSEQGNSLVVDSILTGASTPTVAAAPSADAATSRGPANFGPAGFSNSGFTAQDYELADFTDYVAAYVRDLSDDVNDLRAIVNSLRTTVVALRAALITQGHIV